MRGTDTYIVDGTDGRLLLTDHRRLLVSSDEGGSWRELPCRGGELVLSPDGTEAWAKTPQDPARFTGTKWVALAAGEFTEWAPVGGDVIAATRGRVVFGLATADRAIK